MFFILLSAFYALTNPVIIFNESRGQITASPERLKADVAALTSTPRPRNHINISSLNLAAEYIKLEFEKQGASVTEQKYTANGQEYKNIICSFGPENAERLIVGAHYDVCGEQPGADDNASGTAGLLELSRLLKIQKPDLKYRIDLVAYTLEEPPFFRTEFMGSAVHAKSLHDAGIKVKGMVSLEMIGYFSDAPKSQDYPIGLLKLFYPTTGNFIAVVGKLRNGGLVRKIKKQMRKASELKVKSINAPSLIPGIDFSDHLNYWKYGYDAVMVTNTAFYRNKNYHEPTDTPETLDYEKMAEVVKGVYSAIVSL